MSKTQLKQWAEEITVLEFLNTNLSPVMRPYVISQMLKWSYRKVLRVLKRMRERKMVGVVGNQYQTWYYSLVRCQPMDTGIPF